MRILLVAVGRSRNGPERELYRHYAQRLTWSLTLKEIEADGRLPPHLQKEREGEKLLAAIPRDAGVIALDERGETLDSAGLAKQLGQWRDRGVDEIACLIGGTEGLDAPVKRRADLLLSLGRVTWPHFLVRGLLAEQLYRAQQILAGHPYHRA